MLISPHTSMFSHFSLMYCHIISQFEGRMSWKNTVIDVEISTLILTVKWGDKPLEWLLLPTIYQVEIFLTQQRTMLLSFYSFAYFCPPPPNACNFCGGHAIWEQCTQFWWEMEWKINISWALTSRDDDCCDDNEDYDSGWHHHLPSAWDMETANGEATFVVEDQIQFCGSCCHQGGTVFLIEVDVAWSILSNVVNGWWGGKLNLAQW